MMWMIGNIFLPMTTMENARSILNTAMTMTEDPSLPLDSIESILDMISLVSC